MASAVITPGGASAQAGTLARACSASAGSQLAAVRDGIRAAITAVRGDVPEDEEWTPHVSVAYSSGTGEAAPYIKALAQEDTASCLISTVELIKLNRDNRMYEWETVARVPLSGPQR